MPSGLIIKSKGVPIEEPARPYDPLTLNFGSAIYNKITGEVDLGEVYVPSETSGNQKKITNVYLTANKEKLVIEYGDGKKVKITVDDVEG